MTWLIEGLTRHRRLTLVVALLSALLPASFLPRLRIDNSIEVWLPKSSVNYKLYQEFVAKYGSDEFIVIAAGVDDPFAPRTLELQHTLADKIRSIVGVDRVWDLPTLAQAIWSGNEGWQEQARASAFLRSLVLGKDGKTIGLFVWFKNLKGAEARMRTVSAIEALVNAASAPGFETHMAGAPRMNVALDKASAHDSMIFLPLAIVACVIVLMPMLRTVAGVVAPMCAVGVSAVWTMGLMVMTGHSLNVVTVIMPTLHFVLGLSNGIRLASRYEDNLRETHDADESVGRTLRELLLPLMFMSLTMAIGFLSLLSSDLDPIVELGEFSALGLMIAFLSNALIVAGMLTLLRPSIPPHSAVPAERHWSARTGVAVARHPWAAISVALLLLGGCVALLPGLRTESNVLKFFPDDSVIARDYTFIGERLTGFYTVELDISCPEDGGYETLNAIKKLDANVASLPHVVRVDHIGKTDALPKNVLAGASGKAGPSPFRGLSDRFYAEDKGRVSFRFCVLVNAMASSEYYPLIERIGKSARETLPASSDFHLTGIVSLLNDAQNALVATQIKSFASAFGVIVAMMALLFRSLRAALASILPNLVPIMLTFGWMALSGIHLDAATVMIASVAIGIAVDNTIYFLARYRDERTDGRNSEDAIAATFDCIGGPIAYTSIVASTGFGIVAFAQFHPMVYFGVLTAVTMITALAASLFLTPACVRVFRVWGN